MDTGRSHDIIELYRELDRTSDPGVKESLKRTISLIKNESGSIRSMRESLVRAHRNGDMDEVKDIHEYIKNKSQYSNG